MLIRVRRGLEANRLSYTPQSGEPIFTTDEKKLYVGDGVTPGGILVDMSGSGIVETIVAGTNITVDATDPLNPIVSSTGGGGGGAVDSVNAQTGVVVLDTDDIADTATNRYTNDTDATRLANTSGTNTGDQDISGIATNASNLTTHENDTANPHSVTKTQVGLSNVPNTDFTSAVAANTAKVSYTDAAKVATIETNADVTDTTNVTSAGALMDSEVTNLAQVKAFDSSDYATAAQGALADSATQPGDLATVATTGAYSDLSGTPTVPTSVDDLSPTQATHSGKFLKTDGTNATWEAIPGGGDMLASVYDPTSVVSDAFDMDNMAEGTTNKILTSAERSAITANTAKLTANTVNVEAAGALMDSEVDADIKTLSLPASTTISTFGASLIDDTTNTAARSTLGLGTLATANNINNGNWSGTDLSVANGGTGVSTHTSGNYLKGAGTGAITSESIATLSASVGNLLMPVGFIYVSGVSTNPNTLLGFGTWTRIEGKFVVGVSDSDTDFDLNDTGGSKTVTLTEAQMPSHSHAPATLTGFLTTDRGSDPSPRVMPSASSSTFVPGFGSADLVKTESSTNTKGSSSAHENLPPYIAKYIWQRTA